MTGHQAQSRGTQLGDCYRELFEQCAEAVLLFDAATRRLVEGNPALLRLLGYAAEELQELSVYDVVGHSRASVDTNIAQAERWGGSPIGQRLWRRKDGALVDVDVSVGKLGCGERDLLFAIARAAGEATQPSTLREVKEPPAPGVRLRGRGREAAAPLSRRESQVLKLLAHGFSNRQIATRLRLSVKTVETFRARLYRKLGLRGRPALVRHALRTGMLNAEEPAAADD